MLTLIGIIVGVAALFGWISARILKLPNTIGTMLLTAVTSIALGLLAHLWPNPHMWAVRTVQQIDFQKLVLHGLLASLLFAGAFLIDLDGLREQKIVVALLAVVATVLSVLGVGAITYLATSYFGFKPSIVASLLFGALISPTDPIAVLEMLRRVQTPKYLEAQLAGESLFNDGAGAVIFLALLGATHGTRPSLGHLAYEILRDAGGGILLGSALAYPVGLLMRNVRSTPVDILLSLALALGGFAIADHLGASAPLATVSSALVLRLMVEGQPNDWVAHSELNHFWSNIDEVQNAILFVLLGCGFLVVPFFQNAVLLGLSEILIVNVVRIACVALVLLLLRLLQSRHRSSLSVLSWGGLRGGLSIALALTVPRDFDGGWILTATYVLVVFSILVQGSTMGVFLKRLDFGTSNQPAGRSEPACGE